MLSVVEMCEQTTQNIHFKTIKYIHRSSNRIRMNVTKVYNHIIEKQT